MPARAACRARTTGFDEFPTGRISLRKWQAVTFLAMALQTGGVFVIQYRDGLYWVDAFQISPRNCRMGGWRNPRASNDRELMIDVPKELFRFIGAPA